MNNGRSCLSLFSIAIILSLPLPASTAAQKVVKEPWLTECVGYFNMALPSAFEYSLVRIPAPVMEGTNNWSSFYGFKESIGAWNTKIYINEANYRLNDRDHDGIYITDEAILSDLDTLLDKYNEVQTEKKKTLLDLIEEEERDPAHEIDPTGAKRRRHAEEAARIPSFQRVPGRDAFGMVRSFESKVPPWEQSEDWLDFHVLINGHIVGAIRRLEGSPSQTIELFLAHFKPRKIFSIPTESGACIPYGLITGETEPARIALSMRLKSKPDIVVFLDAEDASAGTKDPKEFLKRHIDLDYFYVSTRADPLDGRLKPFSVIQIDEQSGLGEFASVKREDKTRMSSPVDNPEDNGRDFGYLAYIPGKPGGKPGESFNLIFKVERFGRFAREPMTEKEFRELVAALAAGIHRRPGAWVPH